LSLSLLLFLGPVVILLLLFVWLLRKSNGQAGAASVGSLEEEFGGSHVTYLRQVRQAFSKEDYDFVSGKISQEMQRRMRQERKRIALSYLLALRGEFHKLLRTARVIAALSPEITGVQELERLRLTAIFLLRYRILWISLWAGFVPLPQISNLSNLLSGLSVRLEAAMKELGERAAQVTEMVSSDHRRRIHPV
jgi:hypothetical protein